MNILHPTDFSKTAEKAYVLALDLNERLSASLDVIHVQERLEDTAGGRQFSTAVVGLSDELRKRFEDTRRKEVQYIHDQLTALTPKGGTNNLLWGKPLKTLLKRIHNYDLVVMGAHGADPIDNFFVGGLAGRLVRRSPVPILTVRDTAEITVINRILVATDFGDASQHTWHWCQTLKNAGVKLVAAHVIDIARLQDDLGYTQVVTEALEQFSGDQAERQVLREGNPLERLPELAQEVGADAIAIGLKPHSGFAGFVFGSLTDGLLSSSPVPLLSVPLVQA